VELDLAQKVAVTGRGTADGSRAGGAGRSAFENTGSSGGTNSREREVNLNEEAHRSRVRASGKCFSLLVLGWVGVFFGGKKHKASVRRGEPQKYAQKADLEAAGEH